MSDAPRAVLQVAVRWWGEGRTYQFDLPPQAVTLRPGDRVEVAAGHVATVAYRSYSSVADVYVVACERYFWPWQWRAYRAACDGLAWRHVTAVTAAWDRAWGEVRLPGRG